MDETRVDIASSAITLPSVTDRPLTHSHDGLRSQLDMVSPVDESASPVGEISPIGNPSMAHEGFTEVSPILDCMSPQARSPDTADFSSILSQELICPIDVEAISNRWLSTFIPIAGQQNKEYPAAITAFIYRMLKSYAVVTIRGRAAPPFVHATQTALASITPPLSTCLTIVRMCENPLPGSQRTAVDVLQREMSRLYNQHRSYHRLQLLGAFQAYLIYSMVLFFKLNPGSTSVLRQAMMSLQVLASASSRQGLMCAAEQQNARPRWEAWIVAEANRRTLFTMYLFDSLLSAQDGLPIFLGTELHGLPAPGGRALWRATGKSEWEQAYNLLLSDSAETLRIDELWPIPPDMDELTIAGRRHKVDRWLESVDEFGTMLYAVTSCTHGG